MLVVLHEAIKKDGKFDLTVRDVGYDKYNLGVKQSKKTERGLCRSRYGLGDGARLKGSNQKRLKVTTWTLNGRVLCFLTYATEAIKKDGKETTHRTRRKTTSHQAIREAIKKDGKIEILEQRVNKVDYAGVEGSNQKRLKENSTLHTNSEVQRVLPAEKQSKKTESPQVQRPRQSG